MNFEDFTERIVTDLETFIRDNDLEGILIRYHITDVKKDGTQTDYSYGYIRHWIDLGYGKWMVGIQQHKEGYEGNRFPTISYYPLDKVQFVIVEDDQYIEGEEE